MRQLLCISLLISLTGCFTEIYNKIPCSHDFVSLHAKLKKFGLWSHGESPVGFQWKEKYDSTKVDCATWNISIGIDSCNNIFLNEKYVAELAEIVFNNPINNNIQNINFKLGQRKLFYEISKEKTTTLQLGKLPESKNAQIVQKLSEGYSGTPENKIISLLVDSLPTDHYSIASEFASRNKEYREIQLVIKNINSQICKRVEYLYGFEK